MTSKKTDSLSGKLLSIYNVAAKLKFIFITISLAAIIIKPIRLGADFSSGLNILTISNNIKMINTYKEQLESKIQTNIIISSEEKNLYTLKVPLSKRSQNDIVNNVKEVLKLFPDIAILKIDSIGPKMSQSFLKESIFACFFAICIIFVYVMLRFDIKFAIAGILALSYDILITIGALNFMSMEFSLTTVTAILTIVGYCINDKIVVFDRIRSNFDISTDAAFVIQKSIIDVFKRSLLTSLATLIATFSLYFFHDRSIKDFSLLVMNGIIFGTYSSLFLVPWILQKLKISKKTTPIKDHLYYAS